MSKIRESARNEDCQVRLYGVCNRDSETVVFAHLGGGGMGAKSPENEGAYCCSSCHDVIDFRSKSTYSVTEIKLWHLEGVMRTQRILVKKGLLVIKG